MSSLARLACLALALSQLLPAAALPKVRETGVPLVQNYSPQALGFSPQSGVMAQDPQGVLYIANADGVLVYDGVRWQKLATPKKTPVHALALDKTGKLFIGATGEIGFFAPDISGRMVYTSLKDQVEAKHRGFVEITSVTVTPRGVCFTTRDCLFLWHHGHMTTFKAVTAYGPTHVVRGRTYLSERNVGLLELHQGILQLVPGADDFSRHDISFMLPWTPNPATQEDTILIGTEGGSLPHRGGFSAAQKHPQARRSPREWHPGSGSTAPWDPVVGFGRPASPTPGQVPGAPGRRRERAVYRWSRRLVAGPGKWHHPPGLARPALALRSRQRPARHRATAAACAAPCCRSSATEEHCTWALPRASSGSYQAKVMDRRTSAPCLRYAPKCGISPPWETCC